MSNVVLLYADAPLQENVGGGAAYAKRGQWHGMNGLRTIINDYATKPHTRFILKTLLYFSALVVIVLGTLVIFTFDPCPVVNGVQLPGGFCPAP